jgi:plasmid stabilization system protein ParE
LRLKIVIRPQAEAEIRAAFEWYEGIVEGLGDRFLAELDRVLTRVGESPNLFPNAQGFRRAVVAKFPYCIYFRTSGEVAVVVSVLHGRRDLKSLPPS